MTPINRIKNRFGHWTPRYIYNRARLSLFQFLNPDLPWLTKDAIKIIEQLLRRSDIGVEFGSGRSTVWFAKRIAHLTSVEIDKSWFNKINSVLKRNDLNNISLFLKNGDDYPAVIENFQDESIDFVLVDGEQRDVCVFKSMPKIKKGGFLIIDNINWFAPCKSFSPASRRRGFASNIWEDFFNMTKNWRRILTSNGVTDTLIMFKP
jgi:predicted O-methyltransferase YrrM